MSTEGMRVGGGRFVADHKPGVLHTWTWEHLSGVCAADTGGKQGRQSEWECFLSAPGKDRFYICDPGKNAFGSFYHVREPETERKQLTFADFAACAHKWRTRKVLLRAALDCPQAVAHPKAQLPPGWHDEAPPSLRDKARALHSELDALVDWAWLRKAVLEPCRFGGVLKTMLVACSPGGLQPARFMPFDTLLCQVRGRSRVVLVGPGHTYAGMYPYPVAHPYDSYSMVDFDAPDLGQWPRFVAVRGQAAILGPGEVLFIPRAWWAHIQAMPDQEGDQSAAAPGQGQEVTWLEVELHRGARARVAEAVAPYVGRVVEELAVECEGVAGARGWLRRIGGGTERQAIDLATPLGYKRIRSATAIKDEILLTIGDGADVAAFLEALTEGRMTPTPWLNANFREPLYLKDKPVVVDDTRSEWELRFPQLFAKKLQLEGYEVANTPVSVLNPAHPQFLGGISKAAAA